MMQERNVLRVNVVEEEKDFLEAVHQVIACILAQQKGRTLTDIAETINVERKTISNAFDKRHRLSQVFLSRLGRAFGPECLNPIARLSDGRMIRLEADDTIDALPSTTAAVHRLAVAKSANSPGGERITHTELLELEPELDAAINSLLSLKQRCSELRSAA